MSEDRGTQVILAPIQAATFRAECARRRLTPEQGMEQALCLWRAHPEGLALEVTAFRRIWAVLAARREWDDDTLIAIARICLETGGAIPGIHLERDAKGTA